MFIIIIIITINTTFQIYNTKGTIDIAHNVWDNHIFTIVFLYIFQCCRKASQNIVTDFISQYTTYWGPLWSSG